MDRLFYCNGIDAETGDYLIPPLTAQELGELARQAGPDPLKAALKRKVRTDDEEGRGVRQGLNLIDLADVGWGVVFLDKDKRAEEIREALTPLLARRKEEAGRRFEHFYQEYTGRKALRPGQSKKKFLQQFRASDGPADPEKVPYYLLLVGDPEKIPYPFQFELDVDYAVGRLHFETIEEYGRYADSVVAAESAPPNGGHRAVLFGAENANDPLTRESARRLTQPMAKALKKQSGWKVDGVTGKAATKAGLKQILGGPQVPSLLFTAGHGIGCTSDSPNQLSRQGALVCSDWPGPGHGASPDMYFTGDDVADAGSLAGLISFHFACYSAGTPLLDDYAHRKLGQARQPIAAQPFVARLPQRLLAHPRGGALAVIGHVDRCFAASPQVDIFTDMLKRLMTGYPVGAAVELLNQLHASLAVQVMKWLEGKIVDHRDPQGQELEEMVETWTRTHDAKAYVICGDPAVRVPGTWKGSPA